MIQVDALGDGGGGPLRLPMNQRFQPGSDTLKALVAENDVLYGYDS